MSLTEDKSYRLGLYNHKELCQIAKTSSLENFQQQQQIKWIAHVVLRENNDIIKMVTFHTTLSDEGNDHL